MIPLIHTRRLAPAPALPLITLLAVMLLAACTDGAIEPRPPASAVLAITLSSALADPELQSAFDQAQQVRIRLARDTAADLVTVIEKPIGAEARLSLDVEMSQPREPVRITAELLFAGAPLFRGGGEIVLTAGETTEVPLAVEPVPARVEVHKSLPPIASLGDTVHLRGAVVFAHGSAIPGLALTWRALDPAPVEVDPDGRLVSVAEGEARVEGHYQELADTVRVQVRAVVASVAVEPSTSTLQLGETLQLRALLSDARGNQLATHGSDGTVIAEREVSWISSRPTVAQVNAQSGLVSALGPDTVTITALTREGKSGSARLVLTALPPMVTDCSATRISASEATISCAVDPRLTATEVQVEWGRSASLGSRTDPTSLGGGSTPEEVSQTLTGLAPRTVYFWRLAAVNGGGSARSEVLSFTTADLPPAAPGNLTAAATGLHVELSWNDDSDNEEGFRIERRTATSDGWSEVGDVAADVTGFAERELTAGTTYSYRVRAWNDVGVSDFSNEVQATAYSAPDATTGAASDVSATQARLNGSATPNGAPTEAWFEWGVGGILSSPDSTATQSVGTGTETVTVSASLAGLLAGTTYSYRVAARNGAGVERGAVESFTTPQAAPAAPKGLTATTATAAGAAAIGLVWQDNSHNEEGFRVERRVLAGAFAEVAVVGADVTEYRDESVQAGITYEYRVRAFNASGASSYSGAAQATVPADGIPPPPMQTMRDDFAGPVVDLEKWMYYAEPSRTQQDDRLVVTLTPGVAGYAGLMYRLPHTLEGSSFYAEISQVAAGGPNTETFVGVATPDEEEYVLITSLGGRLSAWRKWRGQPYARVGAEITYRPVNHRFRRIREQDGMVYFEVSADGTSWTQPSNGWSTKHAFSDPRALHGIVGAGAFTPDPQAGTAIFENVNTAVPAIPRALTAAPAATAVALTWQDRSVNEQGFRVERRVLAGAFAEVAVVGADVTEYRDESVQAGITYEYRVRAFNASGVSSHSNVVRAATLP